MKSLSTFLRGWQGLDFITIFETSPAEAIDDFNALVMALANTTPYRKYPEGLSAFCIHCHKRYDPTAEPLNAKAHHEESCIWLQARELFELCEQK